MTMCLGQNIVLMIIYKSEDNNKEFPGYRLDEQIISSGLG